MKSKGYDLYDSCALDRSPQREARGSARGRGGGGGGVEAGGQAAAGGAEECV